MADELNSIHLIQPQLINSVTGQSNNAMLSPKVHRVREAPPGESLDGSHLWQNAEFQPADLAERLLLNPRQSCFFVHRVRQQQDGPAEKQRVEEIVERNHVCGRPEEHWQ